MEERGIVTRNGRNFAVGDVVTRNGQNVVEGSNEAMLAAIRDRIVNSGDQAGIDKLLNKTRTMSEESRNNFADILQASNLRPAFVGQGAIAAIRTNNPDFDTSADALKKAAVEANTYSSRKFATGDKDELASMSAYVEANAATLDPAAVAKFKANAKEALTDARLSADVGKSREVVAKAARNATTAFSQAIDSIQPQMVTKIVQSNGGIDVLNTNDVTSIAISHTGAEIGKIAQQELDRRVARGE